MCGSYRMPLFRNTRMLILNNRELQSRQVDVYFWIDIQCLEKRGHSILGLTLTNLDTVSSFWHESSWYLIELNH